MENKLSIIQQLLQERADYMARLNLIPYDGSPEIKENSSGKQLLSVVSYSKAGQ